MKRFLAALGLLVGLIATPALASNCASYPYTLTNGQTADANQVMANFNSILGCGNSSLAHNGANSDITSLNGLTTPLSILQGGTGNTTGTAANATLAASATKLATGRTIGVTGDLTYTSPSFDGTGNVTAAGTLATVNANVGSFTYSSITVNAKGLVTAASSGSAPAVSSVFGRTGAVVATTGDYAVTNITGAAPLASPAFTGSPTIGGAAVVVTTDARFGGVTQNTQCTYGLVIGDAGKQIYCNTAGTHTLTIPANASVAFPIGTKVELVNFCSAGVLTVAITSDTLNWLPSGTAGSRSMAACSMATLTKVTSTVWAITGTGISYNDMLAAPPWLQQRLPANDEAAPRLRMAA